MKSYEFRIMAVSRFAAMHAKGIATDSLLSTVKTQLAQLEALTGL